MKKSPRLSALSKCNNLLKEKSWVNYLRFLDTLLRSIDHPIAQELLLAKNEKRYSDLVVIADRISSTEFSTAAEHRLCNQLSAVIRKYPFPVEFVDFKPRDRATRTFLSSEHKCKRVNKRFRLFATLRSPHEYVLSLARSYVSYVLGEFSFPDAARDCDFGPGASIGVHGNATNAARKILAPRWTVSSSAYYYARGFLKGDVHLWEYLARDPTGRFFNLDIEAFNQSFDAKARLVDYNNIAFVPKTVKTERTIAVEPLLNGYLQKGVDLLMRKKLKRVGIDLEDQTLNQGLAKFGSIPDLDDDPYVTIDLSAASDSISTEFCRYMLPPDWFGYLDQIRSRSYKIEGVVHPYEKFTTMGNGFCFPLETLLFASLCHAVSAQMKKPSDFSVYGDDIIVRQSIAPALLKLLGVCGFKANRDKTFISGPFRESCGADFWEGEDVRPVTLDYAFDSVENIFKFCNLSRRKSSISSILDQGLEFLESLVPPSLMFTRPFLGNVDTALEVRLDIFMASRHAQWRRDTQCWSWLEIRKDPWLDLSIRDCGGYYVALTRGALTGSKSTAPFTERRKTRTKVRRISYAGTSSTWVPGVLFSRGTRGPFLV